MSLTRVQEIVNELATQISCPVAVNDFALDLIAASAQIGPVDRYRVESIMHRHTPSEVIELLRARSLLQRTEPFMLDEETLPGMHTRMCVPLVDSGFPIAYIWIVLGECRLNESQTGLVRNAADAVLLELVSMREPEDDALLSDSRRLQAVLANDTFSASYAISSLIADGLVRDLRRAAVIVLEFADAQSSAQRDTQTTFRPLHQQARTGWAAGTLLGIAEGRLVAVCSSSDAPAVVAAAEREFAGSKEPNIRFLAAGSSISEHPADGLREAFEEARYAAWVAASIPQIGRHIEYSALGAFIALRRFPATEASVALVSPEAAELRRRDSRVYADTALVYLNCAADVHQTCTELSIHRTTLYYRLDRIREFIGDTLDSGLQRTSLHLGLLLGQLVDAGQ